jgi:hypothetical protein
MAPRDTSKGPRSRGAKAVAASAGSSSPSTPVAAAAPSKARGRSASPAPAPAAAAAAAEVAPAPKGGPVDKAHWRANPYKDPMWLLHLFFSASFRIHRLAGCVPRAACVWGRGWPHTPVADAHALRPSLPPSHAPPCRRLAYLFQYAAAWQLYADSWEGYKASAFVWSLPLNGVICSLSATFYFSFLPKKADPGYYSDNSPLSYAFVKENIFFATLLLWQFLYMDDRFFTGSGSTAGTVFDGGAAAAGTVFAGGAARGLPPFSLALLVPYLGLAVEVFFTFLPYWARPLFPKTSFRCVAMMTFCPRGQAPA